MMALCQDTDAEVRKCMCIQLDALARAVGYDALAGAAMRVRSFAKAVD